MTKKFFMMEIALFLAVAIGISTAYTEQTGEDADPVLEFYVNQAEEAYVESDPYTRNLRFTFLAYSYYKQLGRKGIVERLDSVVTRYFMTGIQIDSTTIVVEATSNIPEPTFSYRNIFSDSFLHNFYPNDTGSADLAIGFDTPGFEETLPTGVAVIDREEYILKRLHMFFQNPVGFKRLTRSFLIKEQNGFIFPDSIWEIGAKQGVFSTDYYKLETNIQQVQLLR